MGQGGEKSGCGKLSIQDLTRKRGKEIIMNKRTKPTSKILKFAKVMLVFAIISSLADFYYERIELLEEDIEWYENLKKNGENTYQGKKVIWDQLEDWQKKNYEFRIKRSNDRISNNTYLIIQHIYILALNIIMLIGLYALVRWVKWYLIFWLASGYTMIPIYHKLIGYEAVYVEQLELLLRFAIPSEWQIALLILPLLMVVLYGLFVKHVFRLIDKNMAQQDIPVVHRQRGSW